MKFNQILDSIKDSVFPHFCVDCGAENEWWCRKCRKEIKPFLIRAEGPLDRVTALFTYSENDAISTLIKDFKYNYIVDIQDILKEIFEEICCVFSKDLVVVPIPLHRKRHRERGFNQAEIIGELIAARYELKIDINNLVRSRPTHQQMKLSKEERVSNVKGAFEWKLNTQVPKKVLLVDDVYTTGATMRECAFVLKKAGAKWVEGLVLAHG